MSVHIPVLLEEILNYFAPRNGQKFVDATIDGGGHAVAIIDKIKPDGKLLGIEWDGELLKHLELKIQNLGLDKNIILVNDSYVNLKNICESNDFIGVDGILFDLGMSSWHLELANRGFSFQKDESLDMRFSQGCLKSAEDIIAKYSYDDLVRVLKEYGEERFAKGIAAGITRARKEKPIRTTFQLIEVIKNSIPFRYRSGRIHFATRTFQALRMEVNSELENIKSGLEQSVEVLNKGGTLAVISFHSLEDRIVKVFLRDKAKEGVVEIITRKPIIPSPEETSANPRARSAKLRIAKKL